MYLLKKKKNSPISRPIRFKPVFFKGLSVPILHKLYTKRVERKYTKMCLISLGDEKESVSFKWKYSKKAEIYSVTEARTMVGRTKAEKPSTGNNPVPNNPSGMHRPTHSSDNSHLCDWITGKVILDLGGWGPHGDWSRHSDWIVSTVLCRSVVIVHVFANIQIPNTKVLCCTNTVSM